MLLDSNVSTDLIVPAITTLLTETEAEFTKEMDKKQAIIDDLHVQLREASGTLGERRRRVEALQGEANEREARKLKASNLERAFQEEESQLLQLQSQYNHMDIDTKMELGDADKGLTIPEKAAGVLSKIVVNQHQPLVIERGDRQLLSSTLPPAHTLRARLNAYQTINQDLEERVKDLQSKDSELAAKYRKIIALCTGVDESRVEKSIESLVRSLESERQDLESGRVREFLTRVDAV